MRVIFRRPVTRTTPTGSSGGGTSPSKRPALCLVRVLLPPRMQMNCSMSAALVSSKPDRPLSPKRRGSNLSSGPRARDVWTSSDSVVMVIDNEEEGTPCVLVAIEFASAFLFCFSGVFVFFFANFFNEI